jgi:hypothetical protein
MTNLIRLRILHNFLSLLVLWCQLNKTLGMYTWNLAHKYAYTFTKRPFESS